MEKLTLCRICLVEDVRMHVVADSHLQEIFEKLTNIPFITEDSRPMLACFFCYARLKQCYKFQQKCLETEAVFTQMLDEEYEQNPMQAELEFFGGFLKTPIEHFSIEDLSQQECKKEEEDIKEELTRSCERIYDVEIKAEYHGDVSDQETKNDGYTGFEDNPQTQSDSDDDLPLTRMKTEVEQVKKKRRATITEREARKKSTPVAKKPKLDIRKEKIEDTVPTKDKKSEQTNLKFIDRTKSSKFKSVTKIIEPIKSYPITKPVIKKNIISSENAALCTNLTNNINNYDLERNNRGINSRNNKKYGLNHSNLSKVNPYKCDVCNSSFTRKSYLKTHIIYKHTGKKQYICDTCKRSFHKKSNLLTHIQRIHTAIKPYKCEICQSSFSKECNLKSHIRRHTGEKPYKCDICQNDFSQEGALKKHKLVHTGEKPYKCDICQRGFTAQDNLKRHIRIHTGERPYKCDICQRGFTDLANLKRHIRVHTGEKPYKCVICQRGFTDQGHLKRHSRVHTGGKLFMCDICPRTFKHSESLKSHIQIHMRAKT